MANWSIPDNSTSYLSVLVDVAGQAIDAATMFVTTPSNQPVGSIRWNRGTTVFEEWSGTAWVALNIAVAGGGTGGTTQSAARTALGLGSLATQNNNAVNITGGSISGVNIGGASITSGVVALSVGGTGANLALGASGYMLASNGAAVVFTNDGTALTLNASNLGSGIVPLGRLSGITDTQIAAFAGIQWSKLSFSGSHLVDIGGVLADAQFTGTYSGTLAFTGNVGFTGSIVSLSNATLAPSLNFALTTSVTATPGGAGLVSIEGFIDVFIGGVPMKLAYYNP